MHVPDAAVAVNDISRDNQEQEQDLNNSSLQIALGLDNNSYELIQKRRDDSEMNSYSQQPPARRASPP